VRKHGDEWQDDPPKPWRRRVPGFGEFRHLIETLRCPARERGELHFADFFKDWQGESNPFVINLEEELIKLI
jgi:hypothetical protein